MGVFINICFIILIVLIIIYFICKIKTKSNSMKIESNDIEKKEESGVQKEKESFFPRIQLIENNKLVPDGKNLIIDTKVKNALATIDNLTPKATIVTRNIKNAKEIAKSGKVFFSATEKDLKKMMNAGKNQYYGTQVSSATKKITGQTKFTKETPLTKNMTKQQLTSAGFNAASMVVGQYYMSEINDKLEKISNSINEISHFQDSEYQGKLLHIASKMEEILENQSEILSNEESRKNAYHDNKELESKCAELLGQANIQISKELTNESLDYKSYESKVKNIEEWFLRQQLTQELLMKIGDLRYVLANGSETSKLSHKQYNNYLNQTNSINKRLEEWHKAYIEKFGIDMDNQRKKGKLFKIREHTIGIINEDWNYNKLKNDIVQQISLQLQSKEFKPYESNKQDEKIVIQKYNGEYYNLPLNQKNEIDE